jgi:hypothetical protein
MDQLIDILNKNKKTKQNFGRRRVQALLKGNGVYSNSLRVTRIDKKGKSEVTEQAASAEDAPALEEPRPLQIKTRRDRKKKSQEQVTEIVPEEKTVKDTEPGSMPPMKPVNKPIKSAKLTPQAKKGMPGVVKFRLRRGRGAAKMRALYQFVKKPREFNPKRILGYVTSLLKTIDGMSKKQFMATLLQASRDENKSVQDILRALRVMMPDITPKGQEDMGPTPDPMRETKDEDVKMEEPGDDPFDPDRFVKGEESKQEDPDTMQETKEGEPDAREGTIRALNEHIDHVEAENEVLGQDLNQARDEIASLVNDNSVLADKLKLLNKLLADAEEDIKELEVNKENIDDVIAELSGSKERRAERAEEDLREREKRLDERTENRRMVDAMVSELALEKEEKRELEKKLAQLELERKERQERRERQEQQESLERKKSIDPFPTPPQQPLLIQDGPVEEPSVPTTTRMGIDDAQRERIFREELEKRRAQETPIPEASFIEEPDQPSVGSTPISTNTAVVEEVSRGPVEETKEQEQVPERYEFQGEVIDDPGLSSFITPGRRPPRLRPPRRDDDMQPRRGRRSMSDIIAEELRPNSDEERRKREKEIERKKEEYRRRLDTRSEIERRRQASDSPPVASTLPVAPVPSPSLGKRSVASAADEKRGTAPDPESRREQKRSKEEYLRALDRRDAINKRRGIKPDPFSKGTREAAAEDPMPPPPPPRPITPPTGPSVSGSIFTQRLENARRQVEEGTMREEKYKQLPEYVNELARQAVLSNLVPDQQRDALQHASSLRTLLARNVGGMNADQAADAVAFLFLGEPLERALSVREKRVTRNKMQIRDTIRQYLQDNPDFQPILNNLTGKSDEAGRRLRMQRGSGPRPPLMIGMDDMTDEDVTPEMPNIPLETTEDGVTLGPEADDLDEETSEYPLNALSLTKLGRNTVQDYQRTMAILDLPEVELGTFASSLRTFIQKSFVKPVDGNRMKDLLTEVATTNEPQPGVYVKYLIHLFLYIVDEKMGAEPDQVAKAEVNLSRHFQNFYGSSISENMDEGLMAHIRLLMNMAAKDQIAVQPLEEKGQYIEGAGQLETIEQGLYPLQRKTDNQQEEYDVLSRRRMHRVNHRGHSLFAPGISNKKTQERYSQFKTPLDQSLRGPVTDFKSPRVITTNTPRIVKVNASQSIGVSIPQVQPGQLKYKTTYDRMGRVQSAYVPVMEEPKPIGRLSRGMMGAGVSQAHKMMGRRRGITLFGDESNERRATRRLRNSFTLSLHKEH